MNWPAIAGKGLAQDLEEEPVSAKLGTFHNKGWSVRRQEDRKRLKEKLKSAFEVVQQGGGAGGGRAQGGAGGAQGGAGGAGGLVVARRGRGGEPWLEYLFGICPPDQRLGKRGSRYTAGPLGLGEFGGEVVRFYRERTVDVRAMNFIHVSVETRVVC
jgi:hypothetical protein